MEETLIIYTDGAFSTSKKSGGWAFVVILNDKQIYRSYGTVYNTTNNRMELMAVIKAVDWLKSNNYLEATIISDSMYIIGTMTQHWKKRKNTDLWNKLDCSNLQIDWKHVAGHSGNQFNEYCDLLAVHASNVILK